MKRWALLVAALYFVILIVLTAPVLKLAFGHEIDRGDLSEAYLYPGTWVVLAVMAISQFAMLAVPVRIVSRRPVTRGALWPTVLAAALMTAALFVGAASSVLEFLFRDSFDEASAIFWVGGLLLWVLWSVVFYRIGQTSAPEDLITRQCRMLFKGSILELLIAVPTHVVARYRDYCCAGVLTFIGLSMGIAVMLFSFGPSVFFLYADRWRRSHPRRVAQM